LWAHMTFVPLFCIYFLASLWTHSFLHHFYQINYIVFLLSWAHMTFVLLFYIFFFGVFVTKVFFNIFIKWTTCFSFLYEPTWLLSLCFTSIFFHQKLMGQKISSFISFFEWLYVAWKQEYNFVLCLLPTWAFMWYYIILKGFFFVDHVGQK
jgi:hypothetical protein